MFGRRRPGCQEASSDPEDLDYEAGWRDLA
jgi:hypothetical protein